MVCNNKRIEKKAFYLFFTLTFKRDAENTIFDTSHGVCSETSEREAKYKELKDILETIRQG